MTAPALVLPQGVTLPPAAALLKAGQEALSKRTGSAALILTAELFAGDHWAGGKGWNGPLPKEAGEAATLVMGEVERTFVSRNLLRDVVERHRNGIAGREPLWSLLPRRALKKGEKPIEAEQTQLDEYAAALTDWWDEGNAWRAVQQALDTALWSGTGHIRLFIGADSLDPIAPDEQGRPRRGIRPGLSLAEALQRINIHAPSWKQSAVTRNIEGRVTGAVHAWEDEKGTTHYEVQEREEGNTIIHADLLPAGTDAEGRPPMRLPVPDLLLYEITLPPLVTDSIRRLSKFLDKTLTMGSRNIDLGGFTETTILNAQMPEGKWVDDPQSPGRKTWRRAEPHLKGAGAVNYINGFALLKEDPDTGKKIPSGITTPSVIYKDPTPFQVFKDSLMTAREMIYDEARQLHVLITGDAAANGVSRQQAVNDFLSSLEPTRIALEHLLRWLFSTVLTLGLHFAGRTDEATQVRVRVQARTSAVQPTAAEVESALKLHATGVISEENFLQRVGVEDVDAERATRLAEGITPALALRIVDAAPAPWIATRALQLAFPALGILDEHVQAQRELDYSAPTEPADLTPSGDDLPPV